MIIDTSAVVAILRDEPDVASILEAMRSIGPRRMSAGTYLELGLVIDGARDPGASALLDDLLEVLTITVEPVTATQARLARVAHQQFGRGSGHPANLNYGDCFAYALARDLNEPLLFKGDDFSYTDIAFVGRRDERRRLRELLAPYGSPGPRVREAQGDLLALKPVPLPPGTAAPSDLVSQGREEAPDMQDRIDRALALDAEHNEAWASTQVPVVAQSWARLEADASQ